jgi:hypothetical protein
MFYVMTTTTTPPHTALHGILAELAGVVIRLLSAATVDDAAPDAEGAGHATPETKRTSLERRR